MLTLADGKPTAEIADHKGELRDYTVEVVEPLQGGAVVLRLTRQDTEEPHVVRLKPGFASCSCKDFTYRSGPAGKDCKHLRLARELLETLAAAAALFREPSPLPVPERGVP